MEPYFTNSFRRDCLANHRGKTFFPSLTFQYTSTHSASIGCKISYGLATGDWDLSASEDTC